MKIRTNVKIYGTSTRGVFQNHNEALVVRTTRKARGVSMNHNEALSR